jgi:hypothetical protein
MASKKKRKPMNATTDRHTSPRVVFHLPQALLDVIDGQAEDNDRTRTAEILRALKGYYRALKLWPPPGEQSSDS